MKILFISDVLRITLAFSFAAGFTFLVIPYIIRVSGEKRLQKAASERDSHNGVVPMLGAWPSFRPSACHC